VIVVLCGGVGGSRFVRALSMVVDPERVTAIVNTGDDEEFHGLYVSPDPDIVTYALAGEIDDERGWGFEGETFRWLEHIRRFGHDTWFGIGDRDLATHLHRTMLLRSGLSLSEVTASIAHAFGVRTAILPMSNDRVRTIVATDDGELPFQRYLVERHARDPVQAVRYEGATDAEPAPGLLEAIAAAEAIFIAPSNPIGSIGPILAIPGVRGAIAAAPAPKVAVSPIIGGRSLQPPAGEMMSGLGFEVSAMGVARTYIGLAETLIIDEVDAGQAEAIEQLGMRCVVGRTIMSDGERRIALARLALDAAGARV
jgi:LPPG:FO 2-phospho-L-lactate transferase